MRWSPVAFLPASLRASPLGWLPSFVPGDGNIPFHLADVRLTPHYPAQSPLDDVLRLVVPGSDEFVTEKYAMEISRLLNEWSSALRSKVQASVAERFLDPALDGTRLSQKKDVVVRAGFGRRRLWKDAARYGVPRSWSNRLQRARRLSLV